MGWKGQGRISGLFDSHQDIDIWCFQEVYKDAPTVVCEGSCGDLCKTLESSLPSYEYSFCPVLHGSYGIATFFNETITILNKGEILVAKGDWEENHDPSSQDHDRKMQWFEISIRGKKILLVNVHCTHRPEGKMDSEKRLLQSKIICDFLSTYDCPKILVGDFNLLPDTESIKIIEESGMISLIKKYNVTSTRTKLYAKPWKFADYIFISPDINVNEFKVLSDVVSDHSPIFIDFDI